MKMPPEPPEEAKFQMAPLIDMVFLLLVFFMCASHLSSSKSLPLEMPLASKGVVPKERPDRWIVNVEKSGQVYSGTQPVTIDELKGLVAEGVKKNPNLKVYVRADQQTNHREVRKVMEAMASCGIDDFIFGVYTPPQSRLEGAAP